MIYKIELKLSRVERVLLHSIVEKLIVRQGKHEIFVLHSRTVRARGRNRLLGLLYFEAGLLRLFQHCALAGEGVLVRAG